MFGDLTGLIGAELAAMAPFTPGRRAATVRTLRIAAECRMD
jgi:hypothetical protein